MFDNLERLGNAFCKVGAATLSLGLSIWLGVGAYREIEYYFDKEKSKNVGQPHNQKGE